MSPAAAMLGRLVVTTFALATISTGVVLAFLTAPMSGGHFAGVALVAAGSGLILRLIHVARKATR